VDLALRIALIIDPADVDIGNGLKRCTSHFHPPPGFAEIAGNRLFSGTILSDSITNILASQLVSFSPSIDR
jgi:hypothetical protein